MTVICSRVRTLGEDDYLDRNNGSGEAYRLLSELTCCLHLMEQHEGSHVSSDDYTGANRPYLCYPETYF